MYEPWFFLNGPTLACFVYFFTVKLYATMIYNLSFQLKHFRTYDKLCLLSGLISMCEPR